MCIGKSKAKKTLASMAWTHPNFEIFFIIDMAGAYQKPHSEAD